MLCTTYQHSKKWAKWEKIDNCNVTQIPKSQTNLETKQDIPCLLEFWSREEAALDRLSIELGCVHWGRRDWDWEVSFTDKPPVMSMLFTFMFGFSPAEGKQVVRHPWYTGGFKKVSLLTNPAKGIIKCVFLDIYTEIQYACFQSALRTLI